MLFPFGAIVEDVGFSMVMGDAEKGYVYLSKSRDGDYVWLPYNNFTLADVSVFAFQIVSSDAGRISVNLIDNVRSTPVGIDTTNGLFLAGSSLSATFVFESSNYQNCYFSTNL